MVLCVVDTMDWNIDEVVVGVHVLRAEGEILNELFGLAMPVWMRREYETCLRREMLSAQKRMQSNLPSSHFYSAANRQHQLCLLLKVKSIHLTIVLMIQIEDFSHLFALADFPDGRPMNSAHELQDWAERSFPLIINNFVLRYAVEHSKMLESGRFLRRN